MNRGVRRDAIENAAQNAPLQFFQARLGRFDQANAARCFLKRAVVIVFEPRLRAFVAEPLQVSKPVQFGGSKLGPLRQCRDGFDVWNGPRGCCCDRLHRFRPGDPASDDQLMAVFVKSFSEAGISSKKADHFAAPRASVPGEGFEISPGERPNPAPVAAENLA